MDPQTDPVNTDGLLRATDGGCVPRSSSTVDLGVAPGFTLATLCSSSGLSVEGQTSTMHTGADENLSIVHNAHSISVTELMNSLPVTTGLTSPANGQTLQWGALGNHQNAIITFHTLPFVEGGQEIAITETCLPANVDLPSPDHSSLVQSLIAQGVQVKAEDAVKNSSVDAGQLIDLASASVAPGFVGQEMAVVHTQLTSGMDESDSASTSLAPVVISSQPTECPFPVITEDTPIFTRVCTTLNADIMNCVPGSREVLLDQLNKEENAQLGIDEQQHFTLEASLATISRVHNRLKDLLNFPGCAKLHLTSQPLEAPPKKTEERGVSCRLLLPFVSSKGRRIKIPSHLPAVMNDNDAFDSEDSDEPIKPPRQKRKGRPRKVDVNSSVIEQKEFQENAKTQQPADFPTSAGFHCDVVGEVSKVTDELSGQGEETMTNDIDLQNNFENILDASQRPGVLRKARPLAVISQATRKRRIYEGRVKFKFFCDMCSFKSKRESHFRKHVKLHAGGRTSLHCCTECDFKTIRLSHLQRHKLLHKNSLLKCNLCGYMTDSNQMLCKHMKLKHPNGRNSSASQQQVFNCEVCGHSSSNRNYFTRHLMRHARDSNNATVAGPDGFQCPECTKTFQRRVHYDRHLRDVHGPQLRPHLCDICGKSFKRPDALQQHKVVHTSQASRTYPFHCNKCNKGFRSQAHLKEHSTMHSSERPFLCHYCGSSFKTQSVQRKHILSLHLKPRAHSCALCTKKFNTPYALHRHNRTHEAEVQKLAVAAQNSSQVTIDLGMDTDVAAAHLEQVNAEGAVVAVDAGDGLQVQQQTLVQDVLATGIEESLEQGDTLQTEYIVQGNETATALFYLTGSL